MARQCNIDGRGRLARLIWGVLLLAIAAVLAWRWAWPAAGGWPWVVTGLVALAGLFAIYEARAGWCVMRAMGIKTPM